jgi:ankyrin repeat protein
MSEEESNNRFDTIAKVKDELLFTLNKPKEKTSIFPMSYKETSKKGTSKRTKALNTNLLYTEVQNDSSDIESSSENNIRLFDFQKYDIFSFARHNKFSELETLFMEGLNPDSKDEHGNTILIIAAQNNNKRIIKIALRYGAQINMQNMMGNTALHFAKEYKYDSIFEYLIQKGADTEIKNLRGMKAKEGLRKKIKEKELFLGLFLDKKNNDKINPKIK